MNEPKREPVLWGSLSARIAGCVLLVFALNRMPYGYYTFLRIYLVLVLGHSAHIAFKQHQVRWTWILGVTAFTYNPILPMHFGRDGWSVVNVITIPVVLASCFFINRKRLVYNESN